MRRARVVAFWVAMALAWAWVMDVALRRDAGWRFARQYASAHGCRYERGIPYRMVCP